MGTASQEMSARSSSLDQALTTTDIVIRPSSTQGSANVDALRFDKAGLYVQVSGIRVMELDIDFYTYDYKSTDLTLLVPYLNLAGITQIALQRKPDTRLHCVRADGTVAIMVIDTAENVICWQVYETDGIIEDVSVLPGTIEDQVYYVVNRTINGVASRAHEKWATELECNGLPDSRTMDSHVIYAGPPVTAIGGLDNLEGATVAVWGWNTEAPYVDGNGNTIGLDLGRYVVSGGQITGIQLQTGGGPTGAPYVPSGVAYPVTNATVGLPYTAQWQSMKQAFAAALGTPLNQPKRINKAGLVLLNTHAQGIGLGTDFGHLDDLAFEEVPPLVTELGTEEEGVTADLNAIMNEADTFMTAIDDLWSTDSRVCLQAQSPRPACVLACTVNMDTNDEG